MVLAHTVFDERYGTGKKCIGQAGAENTDDFHGIQSETTGKRVWRIAHVFHGIQYHTARFFANPAVAIEDTRYSSDGNMAFFGNIIDSYVHI